MPSVTRGAASFRSSSFPLAGRHDGVDVVAHASGGRCIHGVKNGMDWEWMD
jgi:hypothetical protein